ncbi:hypothetical protein AWB79_06085 [Caballeronia hypogeia]|uniref:Uncharacterized protein n=1 Tax=Caballeronia hypogeia TaxID=1777140 RepID=A0A158CW04_9BURK|nr:hypothetical protein AWB79_06085 [Caballeronia hypogeia]
MEAVHWPWAATYNVADWLSELVTKLETYELAVLHSTSMKTFPLSILTGKVFKLTHTGAPLAWPVV